MRSLGEKRLLITLLKDFGTYYNSRSISKIVGMTHEGAFKALKNLERRGFVVSKRFGKALMYRINYTTLAKKTLELLLLEEAEINYERWVDEIKYFNETKIIILFGSVLKKDKKHNDVDLLMMVTKEKYNSLMKRVDEKNKVLLKKIHPIIQTPNDLKSNLLKKNPVILDAIRTGIVLKGQCELVEVLSNVPST